MSTPVHAPQCVPGTPPPHYHQEMSSQGIQIMMPHGDMNHNGHNVVYGSEEHGVYPGSDALINNGEDDEPRTVPGSSQGDATSSEDVGSEFTSDPIKLFVGQVPKSMTETDLFPIFLKYGPIQDVVVIRDKHTGQHRGCAFVTFLTNDDAVKCESELHNQHTLPGGRRPVQIRPAGRKEEVENKVFVGMLPRDVREETIRQLFEPFGEISGVYIIRNNDGVKKGCAFVKYVERESAIQAIERMNDQAVEGAERPLIVKFADTRSQKRARQSQQARRGDPSYAGPPSPVSHASQGTPNGNLYFMPPGPPPIHYVHPPAQMGMSAMSTMSTQHTSPAVTYSPQGQYYPNHHSPGPSTHPSNFMYQQVNPYGLSPDASHYITPPPHDVHRESFRAPRPVPQRFGMQREMSNPRPREGPAGANLFIYHLPHDLTDADLATAFNPFGNVISAKVYVDMLTGESKGFGFVSYDSVISAELAIEQMNGFQIGSKRLKVQHKRVNHRPPVGVPPVHSFYPQGQMDYPSMQDIPPSIEISSVGDDTETAGQTNSSQSSPHNGNDVQELTTQFGGLQTEQRPDEYEE